MLKKFETIVGSALKIHSIKVRTIKKFVESISFWVKIGYHSHLNSECNTERCYLKSLSIVPGLNCFELVKWSKI